MKKKLKIFIGSSSGQLSRNSMLRIATIINRCGHSAIPWDDPEKAFSITEYTWDELRRIGEEVDAAVFIFGSDDETWYGDKMLKTPRDNVLLEYGLFCGLLGRTKVVIARAPEAKVATDLKGITYLVLDDFSGAELRISSWIKKLEDSNVSGSTQVGRLVLEAHSLKIDNEVQAEEIRFLRETVQDLTALQARGKSLDITEIALESDGFRRLLFDYTFFAGVAGMLARPDMTPEQWRLWLEQHRFTDALTHIIFEHLNDAGRTRVFIRKALRVFRTYSTPRTVRRFFRIIGDEKGDSLLKLTNRCRDKLLQDQIKKHR